MRLQTLELRNFLSHEETSLDLSAVDSAALVGPIGSGKSALQEAMRWCLFGTSERANLDELVREGQEAMSVRTAWILRGREVVITRERSRKGRSSLTLEVDGQDRSKHTMPETTAAIARLIGMSEAAILAAPVMVQLTEEGREGGLMAVGDADRKQLVQELFRLDRFEVYHRAAKKARDEASAGIAALDAETVRLRPVADDLAKAQDELRTIDDQTTTWDAELAQAEAASVELRAEAAALIERGKRVQQLDADIGAAQRRLDQASRELGELEHWAEDVARRLAEPEPEDADVDGAMEHMTRLQEHSDQLMREWHENQTARSAIAARISQLRSSRDQRSTTAVLVDNVPCHGEGEYATCQLLAHAVHAKLDLPGFDREIQQLEQQLAGMPNLVHPKAQEAVTQNARNELHRAQQLHTGHAAWAARQATTKAEQERVPVRQADARTRHDDAQAEIQKLNAERVRLAQDYQRQAEVTAQLQQLTDRINNIRAGKTALEPIRVRVLARIEAGRSAVDRLQAIVDEEDRLVLRRDVMDVLTRAYHRDGVPTLLLEQIIPAIEDEANAALARMPGEFRIRLVTQVQSGSGSVQEKLRIVVDPGTGRERAYKLLSGGQRLRVDLALRLAVSSLLGNRFETFWLDEPSGNQDQADREALIELIAVLQQRFGLVIVASHQEDIAERFPARIETVLVDPATSRCELIA